MEMNLDEAESVLNMDKGSVPIPCSNATPLLVGIQNGCCKSKFYQKLESVLQLVLVRSKDGEGREYLPIQINGEMFSIKTFSIEPIDALNLLKRRMIDLFVGTQEFLYDLDEQDCDFLRVDIVPQDKEDQVGTISLLENSKSCFQGQKQLVTKFDNWEKLLFHPGSSCSTDQLRTILQVNSAWISVEDDLKIGGCVREFMKNPFFQYGIDSVYFDDPVWIDHFQKNNKNNVECTLPLRKLFVGAWIHGSNATGREIFRNYCPSASCIFLEGTDGTGKTTTIKMLKKERDFKSVLFSDRNDAVTGILVHTDLELLSTNVPFFLKFLRSDVVVLSCRPTISLERIEKRKLFIDAWENPRTQHYLHRKYLELAFHYGWTIVDTTVESPSSVVSLVKKAIYSVERRIPVMAKFDANKFESLKELKEEYDLRYHSNWSVRQLDQNYNVIKNDGASNAKGLRSLLYLLALEGIESSMVYVGKEYMIDMIMNEISVQAEIDLRLAKINVALIEPSHIDSISQESLATIAEKIMRALVEHLSPRFVIITKLSFFLDPRTGLLCGLIRDERGTPLHESLTKNPDFHLFVSDLIEENVRQKYLE